jgi:glucose/arabinose dehydrogenase
MMINSHRTLAVLAAALALSSGCGSNNGGDLGTNPPPAGGVPEIELTRVFTDLSFVGPTALKQAPGDGTRWFVAEKRGYIRVFANNPDSSATEIFLDLSSVVDATGEGGLLGFAFHPDFPVTPEVYVSYTRSGAPLVSYLSRFTSTDGGLTLVAGSEDPVLTVLQPRSNHNGGDVTFGPDGYLYAGFGDGGGGGDPLENAQDETNLHGSVIRVDVDGAVPYAVPPGNPNAGNAACTQGYGGAPCPEIFAWGFRNPWRLSFDRATGRLWVGDVGQGDWEEVDIVERGRNYGWDEREGDHCYEPPSGCLDTFADPVAEYDHSLGRSVTGGYVYRGTAIADLVGWYVFGDFGSGKLFAVTADSVPVAVPDVLLESGLSIVTFGEGADGELYVVDYGVGTIHRIEAAP